MILEVILLSLAIIVSIMMLVGIIMVLVNATFELDMFANPNNDKKYLALCLVISIIVSIVPIVCLVNWSNKEYENYVCEIASWETDSEISGSGRFVLGIGHARIQTNRCYYIYSKDENGYKLKKLAYEDTYIAPLEESKYTVPTLTEKKVHHTLTSYNVLYIPEDYIVSNFKI